MLMKKTTTKFLVAYTMMGVRQMSNSPAQIYKRSLSLRKHKSITTSEAVLLINDENTIVVDVREPSEFAEGHIQDAINIPLAKLADRAYELEGSKNLPILVTCQSGTRSLAAGKKLTSLGFTKISELRGGMYAWKDQSLPISKKR